MDSTENRFTAGEKLGLIEVDGRRLGLALCKDTGIAEHAARTVEQGVDVYVAGLVMHPHELGIQNDRGRGIAVRHRVPVALAGFAGPTGGGYDETAGGSGIWSSDGSVLAQVGPQVGAFARAELA